MTQPDATNCDRETVLFIIRNLRARLKRSPGLASDLPLSDHGLSVIEEALAVSEIEATPVPKLNGPQDHATVIERVAYLLRKGGHGDYAEAIKSIFAVSATRRAAFSLRHLQANLPWTLPYSDHFEATAYPLDRVKHDVLHVMKSLGRIAAECENHDHGRDRKLIGDAFAKEVADLVICALHIAKLQGFDLQDAVVNNSEARNAASIPEEA